MGTQSVVLGNGSEEDVLGVRMYQPLLREGNKLLFFYALYARGVLIFCLLSLVSLMKSRFGFSSCQDGLNILFNGNEFGHASLMNNFLVPYLDDSYNINTSPFIFVSHFLPRFRVN